MKEQLQTPKPKRVFHRQVLIIQIRHVITTDILFCLKKKLELMTPKRKDLSHNNSFSRKFEEGTEGSGGGGGLIVTVYSKSTN